MPAAPPAVAPSAFLWHVRPLVLLQLLVLLFSVAAQTIAPTNDTLVNPDFDNVLLVFNDTRIYHTTTLEPLLPEALFPVRWS